MEIALFSFREHNIAFVFHIQDTFRYKKYLINVKNTELK